MAPTIDWKGRRETPKSDSVAESPRHMEILSDITMRKTSESVSAAATSSTETNNTKTKTSWKTKFASAVASVATAATGAIGYSSTLLSKHVAVAQAIASNTIPGGVNATVSALGQHTASGALGSVEAIAIGAAVTIGMTALGVYIAMRRGRKGDSKEKGNGS